MSKIPRFKLIAFGRPFGQPPAYVVSWATSYLSCKGGNLPILAARHAGRFLRRNAEMRVSQFYKLGRSQPTLDFVDVDTVTDTPVFISPKALTMLPSEFGDECVHAIQSFFKTILALIRAGRNGDAERLLRNLREPNETRFGLEQVRPAPRSTRKPGYRLTRQRRSLHGRRC